MDATHTEIDELDRPRTLPELAAELQRRGEKISDATLYRWARNKMLPVAECGRMTSTLRAYYLVRTPKLGDEAGR
jgi:hypothetical protein